MTKKSAAACDETAPDVAMPASGQHANYAVPVVTITTEGQDMLDGPSVLNPAQLERRRLRQLATAIIELPIESLPEAPPAPPPAIDTSAMLCTAAQAVNDARANLERTNGRLADVRQRSRELAKLTQAVAAAHDRRAQVLADALIEGKKGDLKDADKQIGQASQALTARADEVTAAARALQILEAQQKAAEDKLAGCERAFKDARATQLGAIAEARRLTAKFHEAITTMQACVARLPQHFAAHLPKVDLDFLRRYSAQLQEVQDAVSSQAEAELVKADQLASIRPPESPVEHLGYVWADNSVHPDPEPAPSGLLPLPNPGSTFGADKQPGNYAS